jgi:signal transduction histidine kinase
LTRQIVTNLVSNAVKYTDETGKIEITVRPAPSGSLDVIVADNGIGIPKEKFGVIMEPFGQVEDAFARSKGGVGLGLPLVKALAHLHGAELTIDSELGRGTSVCVRFPPSRVTSGCAERICASAC